MTKVLGSSCCVCGTSDARSLVDVVLMGGAQATLCGSHALMHRRSATQARTGVQLREILGERRGRRDAGPKATNWERPWPPRSAGTDAPPTAACRTHPITGGNRPDDHGNDG